MIKTKNIIIGNYDINIIAFNPFEAIKLRAELVEFATKKIDNFDVENQANMLKMFAQVIYCIPTDLLMKLLKNCTAVGVGALSEQSNFNKVFENNLDDIITLVIEIIQLSGFFSLNSFLKISENLTNITQGQNLNLTPENE